MKTELLDSLRCPSTHRKLHLKNLVEKDGQIESGWLIAEDGAEYPIVRGIPRFVPRDNYADNFGFQWNIHRKTQLDSYTGLPLSRDRLFTAAGWPESLKGLKILEAGSGAGRFTEAMLKTGASIISFDFSNAVEANLANNGSHPNLYLFQGDIYKIPLVKNSFDKVVCLGVLQHTPNPKKAFMSLTQFVKPGGELVIDVYRADILTLLHWKYLLRPLTKRMDKERLYKIISAATPILIPLSAALRKMAGRAGARLIPILEYSHLGLAPDINKDWSILDTFDMYSPVYDIPQTLSTVNQWFLSAGFIDIDVRYGPNGIVGRGRNPIPTNTARQ